MGRYSVDGLFVISPHLERKTAENFSRLAPTILLFNPKVPGLASSSIVSVDNFAAGRAVAAHFLALGHKDFGYVHGILAARTDRERYEGFAAGLAAAGCTIGHEAVGGYVYKTAAEAVAPMLQAPDGPTAIFCANDLMAMGVADAARYRHGLRLPHDLSIAGFDDIPAAAWDSYALTTVRQPVDDILDSGFDLLKRHFGSSSPGPEVIVHPAGLVVRQSTGPAP
jgi:LacI family transcriptional regulator